MNTCLCIVARTASKRLPKKAHRIIFNDINLIDLLILRLKCEFNTKQIVLATTSLEEDNIFEEIAKRHLINVFRGHEKNVLDRLLNAAKSINNFDNIVRITGDNPLTDPKVLKNMISEHEIKEADYTFTESIPVGTRAEILSVKFLNFLSKNIIDKENTEYMTYYFKKDLGQKTNNCIFDFCQINSGENLTVDTFEDFEFLRSIFNKIDNNIFAKLEDIINIINKKKLIKSRSNIPNRIVDLNDFNLKTNTYE